MAADPANTIVSFMARSIGPGGGFTSMSNYTSGFQVSFSHALVIYESIKLVLSLASKVTFTDWFICMSFCIIL